MMSAKKNVTLRAAAVLFALALITSCFVGGTFAKYVTNGTGTDTARVAKFGVTVTANGTMFATKYKTDTPNVAGTIAESVISSGAVNNIDNVVAPGTEGEMLSMKLSGQPEVAVQVTYTPTIELNDEWKDANDNFYCPLQIKVNGTIVDGHGFTDKQEFVDAIVNAIVRHEKNNVIYKAGTDLSTDTVGDNALAITWAWPFESTDGAGKSNDAKDTYLGDQAAKGHAATIKISVVTTVTQVD